MDQKKQIGDVFALSKDIQKIRIEVMGRGLQNDLSQVAGKPVTFKMYDSVHQTKDGIVHMCRVYGQSIKQDEYKTNIEQFLIPEHALISIADAIKANSNNIKGIYRRVFSEAERLDNINQFAFDVAQQANTDPMAKQGIEKAVGKEIVELSLALFPNVKLGDTYKK